MATATVPEARNGTHVPASPETATAVLTTVTPQMAADWLATAHPNRPPSRARVKTIARAIAAGLWQVNGQTLVLCPEFRLLDGRHRCLAIVDAGHSVETFVVIGIDPLCFASMDQGSKRSGSDILAIGGHKHSQSLCSTLRWLWRYQNWVMLQATIGLLDYELPSYLAQHRTITTSLEWGLSVRALLPPGLGAMLYDVMHAADAALVKEFFHGLAHGAELKADDPIYLVREKLLHDRRDTLFHKMLCERAAIVINSWNSRRSGQLLKPGMLSWRGDNAAFPTVE